MRNWILRKSRNFAKFPIAPLLILSGGSQALHNRVKFVWLVKLALFRANLGSRPTFVGGQKWLLSQTQKEVASLLGVFTGRLYWLDLRLRQVFVFFFSTQKPGRHPLEAKGVPPKPAAQTKKHCSRVTQMNIEDSTIFKSCPFYTVYQQYLSK